MEYALIGEKLGHSFSKQIHNSLCDYDYQLQEIEPCDLKEFLQKRDFLGLNVTIPYKERVMEHLDNLSPLAKRIGAVNTVVNKNGVLTGYNTDYHGFIFMLKTANIDVKDKIVAVLGSGGASKMARVALNDLGAKEIIVVSRNGEYNYQTIRERKDIQVIVNATPVGMYPNNGECMVDLNDFCSLTGVVDMVYNPSVTELLFRAKQKNIPCVNGLLMLVGQAKYASEFFTDTKISDSEILRITKEIQFNTQNIVIVGMPGSGKTTIGKMISEHFNRPFFDSDVEFKNAFNKTPGDYITEFGEQAFRDKEEIIISDLSKRSGTVIATGGGSVLRPNNRKNIRQEIRLFLRSRCFRRNRQDA